MNIEYGTPEAQRDPLP